MRLTEYTPETYKVAPNDAPIISVTLKNGQFRINAAACDLLGITKEDQIKFIQDECTGIWYVEKVSKGGFALIENFNICKGLTLNNAGLGQTLAESFDVNEKSVRFELVDPVKFDGRFLYGLTIPE